MKMVNERIEKVFTYHKPKAGQAEKYAMLRDKAKELAYLIDGEVPLSAEKIKAMEKLEEVVMWANAGLARN